MKNDATFKKNENLLKELSKKLDEKTLSEKYKNIISDLGDCPMSQCNVVELMKQSDCMCLTLDISRSEACINDPSKLIIKQIIPSFMSLDSFLDSAIFKLEANRDAAGGFDYKN